jgi:hypothetical protein
MKPYVICHMNTSIDGRTWGSRWRPAENRMAGLFERIHEKAGCAAVTTDGASIAWATASGIPMPPTCLCRWYWGCSTPVTVPPAGPLGGGETEFEIGDECDLSDSAGREFQL